MKSPSVVMLPYRLGACVSLGPSVHPQGGSMGFSAHERNIVLRRSGKNARISPAERDDRICGNYRCRNSLQSAADLWHSRRSFTFTFQPAVDSRRYEEPIQ
jgi:hypothetical protein